MFGWIKKIFGSAHDRLLKKYRKIVVQVNEWDQKFNALSDAELQEKTALFKRRLQEGEPLDKLLPEAYAVVKNVCRRLIGTEVHVSGYNQKWDMVPYDVQVLGGIAMHYGAIAEMHTGEGKTLTAVMPLYLNALTGKPVHLVTVNDYLATRDCEWVGTVLRWLGITTATLTNQTPMEARKALYEADVVYGTASEFGFDYLRDNSMAMSRELQVQRGYYFAIIDEVDSILIDEARTPLIISGPVPNSRQMYDALKVGVSELVRLQKDLCHRYALEARRVIEASLEKKTDKKDKKEWEALQEAYRKLWLVGKGTPRNKVLRRLKEDPENRNAIDKWDLYYHAEQNKEEKQEVLADLFMIVDEKGNEYELTDKGIGAWAETPSRGSSEDFVMLDISEEYIQIDADSYLTDEQKMAKKLAVREEDSRRKERAHNLRQLLRAHLLMERDVDYIVDEQQKIVIIDENTGRPQPGRRFADGLHQAIEAKEGVEIQKETQTYATITLQNYFRMYEKLAGMTGTAVTEAQEFKETYGLDVLEIPTHRPCQRVDFLDEVYMTEREKYQAILKDVQAVHDAGRPILMGTESVEVSEKLSRIFLQNRLPHTVLNAKQHEKEAEIIAQAGRRGAITIATNMAGRGTDIKLEPGVADLGGLYVLVASRQSSRRLDRQYRGRCARQGDPGSSKFYVSFEDGLLRLFASPRMTAMLQRFRPPEGEPISARLLNKSIETAQKRVEQRNASMRKHTLEYDDVMNRQRQEIYAFRNDILRTQKMETIAMEVLESVSLAGAESFVREGYDGREQQIAEYRSWLMQIFPLTFEQEELDQDGWEVEELGQYVAKKVCQAFSEKLVREQAKIQMFMPPGQDPSYPIGQVMRSLMLRRLDQIWQEHLLHMDHLRADVMLRAVGQRDPLMEFKHEAFRLFAEAGKHLREEIAKSLFRFELIAPERVPAPPPDLRMTKPVPLPFAEDGDAFPKNEKNGEDEMSSKVAPFVTTHLEVGRNDLCPCGSGKKYKKCCHSQEERV